MKKIIIILILLPVLAAACLAAYGGIRYFQLNHPVTYTAASYREKAELLSNPYCGFHEMYGFALTEEGIDPAASWSENILSRTDCRLLLLQVNLRNYPDRDLTPSALEQLDYLLDTFSSDNRKLILRFIYDWDGKAKEAEPDSREQIIAHMGQVADSVNRHKSSVLTLQGIFTGNCGEMNGSNYGKPEDLIALANALAKVIDPEIYLAVRTPSHLRIITGSWEPATAENAYSGTLPARLGLYNDGMLGSVYDLGTYDDTPWTADSLPPDKGTREEEIGFQNTLCRFVPNGGEAVLDNPYNDLPAAIADLSAMHVSYLNAAHDKAVMDKWKASVYTEDGPWNGVSGYDYIAAHLGYRYLVTATDMAFDTFHDDAATFSITLENTGFAPAYRRYDSLLSVTNQDTGEKLQLPLDWDNRSLCNDAPATVSLSIPVRELPAGTYSLTLSMTDPASGQAIRFANDSGSGDEAAPLFLGSFVLE